MQILTHRTYKKGAEMTTKKAPHAPKTINRLSFDLHLPIDLAAEANK